MSDTARKAVRNTALLTVFEIANPLVSLVLIGTMSRHLGAEGLGAYNLLLYFFFVAHAFTSLGLNTLVTREVSRDPKSAPRYLYASSALGLLISAMAGIVILVALRHGSYGEELAGAGWIVALCLFPSIVILQCESIFIAYEQIQYIVYIALAENVGRTVVGLWFLQEGFGVTALLVSFALFRYLALVLSLLVFRRRIARLNWRPEASLMKDLALQIPVFGGILVASTLYWKADVLLLSKMADLVAVGYYTAAYRLFAIAQVLPKSFNTSIYPVLSKLFLSSPEEYRKANSLAIRYVLVALLPIAAGIHGLAEPIVRMLFGKGFEPAVPVLQILIWTLVPYGIVRVLASGMFASNRQALDLKVNLLGLGANVLMNVVLIRFFGIEGCAWATLLSICLFLLLQCLFLGREILPVFRQAEIIRPAFAAAMISVWLYLTPGVNIAVRIGGGAILYAALLALLRVVRLDELKMVLPARMAIGLGPEAEP